MADHHQPAQTQQIGAADGLRVELSRSGASLRADRAGRPASRRCPSGSRRESRRPRSWPSPSSVFSATLPVKPSVTTTSTSPRARSSPSTLPAKSNGASASEASRSCAATTSAVPLPGLLAHRQQPHARPRHPEHAAAEGRAHEGELDQLLGPHLDVGADVEQQRPAAGDRHQHGERRPVHAAHALARAAAPRPAPRRWSRRYERIGAPSATARAASTIEAPVFARTACAGSSLLEMPSGASATSIAGAGPPSAARSARRARRGCSVSRSAAARRAGHHLRDAPVGAEHVYCDCGDSGSRSDLRCDHLAAAVVAALRADPVRPPRRVALRALVDGRGVDRVLRAPLVGARVGLFLLWDGHVDPGRLADRALLACSSRSFAQRGSPPSSWRCSSGSACSGSRRRPCRGPGSPRGRGPWAEARARARRAPSPQAAARRPRDRGCGAPRRRPAGRPRGRPPRPRGAPRPCTACTPLRAAHRSAAAARTRRPCGRRRGGRPPRRRSRVALAAEREPVEAHPRVDAPAVAGAQAERVEIEEVEELRHGVRNGSPALEGLTGALGA